MLKSCTLIGSDKGGVGKSLIAQIMVLAYDNAGIPIRLVEIDHQRKLSNLLGRRVDLSLAGSPDIETVLRDRRAIEAFYNPCYEVWSSANSITDLGANVTSPLLGWMRHNDIASIAAEDAVLFRFVAVASPDDQSLRSAIAALREARSVLGPGALLYLVLNETTGLAGFAPYMSLDLWKEIEALPRECDVAVVNVPYCDSAIMEWGRAQGRTILDLVQNVDSINETIARDAGLDRLQLRVHTRRFADWIRGIQASLVPLFDPPRLRGQVPMAAE